MLSSPGHHFMTIEEHYSLKKVDSSTQEKSARPPAWAWWRQRSVSKPIQKVAPRQTNTGTWSNKSLRTCHRP